MSPLIAGEWERWREPLGTESGCLVALGLLAVQNGEDRQAENLCEPRSDGSVYVQLPVLVTRNGALVFVDRIGYLLLGKPFFDSRLLEVISHGC